VSTPLLSRLTSPDDCTEYPFAKYNVQPTVYTYSQDEYNRLLEGTLLPQGAKSIAKVLVDKDWTKEETDYLFNVVPEYDLRWYVIHDRYDYPGGVPRALEVCTPSFRSAHVAVWIFRT
jgi:DNA methyltransferase 1-associated protein 1